MHKNREKNLALKREFLQNLFKFYGKICAIILTLEKQSEPSAKERI